MIARSNAPCRLLRTLFPLLLLFGVGGGTASWGAPPDLITLRTEASPAGGVPAAAKTGQSVAVNDRWILLGQPQLSGGFLSNIGGVQVHRTRDGEFDPQTIFQSHVEPNQLFGFSVALCGDIALVGAPGEGSFSGAVYLYDLRTGNELGRIVSPDPAVQFGMSIAVSQDWAVIGAPGSLIAGTPGAVYLLYIPSVGPGLVPTLIPISTPAGVPVGGEFGRSVAFYDRLLLVGAPGDASSKGSAFLIDLQGILIEKLEDTFGVAGDRFGQAVAMTGQRAAVGAPEVNASTGKVLLFDIRKGAGSVAELTPLANFPGAEFGTTLAMSDDLVFVNDFIDEKVDVFRAVDGERSGQVNPTPEFAGLSGFGTAIAVEGNRLLIGDPLQSGDDGFALYLPHYSGEPGSFRFVATGDSPPELTNARVSRIEEGCLSRSGLAYCASLVGSGAARGRNKGVFFGSEGLAGQRANLDSTGLSLMLSLEKPNTAGGGVFFEGRALGAGRQVIHYDPIIGALNIFGNGKSIFLLSGERVQSFGRRAHSENFGWATPVQMRRDSGAGVTAVNDGILLHLDANGSVDGFVREGSPAPLLGGGELIGQIPRVAFTDEELVYPTFLRGSSPQENQALYRREAATGTTVLVARKGVTVAPNPANTTLGTFLGETSSFGPVSTLFRASLNRNPNVTSLSNEGLYAETSGALLQVVRKGDVVAFPNAAVSRILQFWAIKNSVRVDLFTAKLRGPGVNPSNDCVLLYRNELNQLSPLLREGELLPGTCNNERVGRILRVDADPFTGAYAVIVSVVGASPQNNLALLLGNCTNSSAALGANADSIRRPFVVTRKGRSHQEFFGGTAGIASMNFTTPGPDRTGAGGGGIPQSVSLFFSLVRVTYDNRKMTLATFVN